jgi:hypothetical protein
MPSLQQRLDTLRMEITTHFKNQGFTLLTNIDEVSRKDHSLSYVCKCGNERKQSYKDMIRKNAECRGCKSHNFKSNALITPTDFSVCPTDDPNEIWYAIPGGFVSNKKRCCNFSGRIMTQDERQRVYWYGKLTHLKQLLSDAAITE